MPKKNNILLEKKQLYPKDDDYEDEDIEEEIVEEIKQQPTPKPRKQILKNDNNEQEELIKQLVDQMAEKKLKEKEIKPKGKRGPKLPLSEKHIESLKNGFL